MNPKDVGTDILFHSIEEYRSQQLVNNTLSKLSYALDEAIDNENFEVAAKLRDKIKSIENIDK